MHATCDAELCFTVSGLALYADLSFTVSGLALATDLVLLFQGKACFLLFQDSLCTAVFFTVSGQGVHVTCYAELCFTVKGLALATDLVLLFQDKACMLRVMQNVDKANGYVFGESDERTLHALMSCASGAEFEYEKIANIQEKHMDSSGEPMDNDDIT